MKEKERYKLESYHEAFCEIHDTKSDEWYLRKDLVTDLLNQQDKRIAELEAKLADSEKQIKDAREAGNMTVDSWCKNRRKYEAQIAEMQNKSFILYSMLYETLEKQGCDNVASQIDQMTGWTYDKEADWLKGNRNYDQLKQQLEEKEKEIAYLTKQVKKFNNEAQKYFEDAYCNDFHNQDKISFAVEVLKIAQDYVQQYVNNFDDMNDCLCAIDNQIKRLTHQHEDKGE